MPPERRRAPKRQAGSGRLVKPHRCLCQYMQPAPPRLTSTRQIAEECNRNHKNLLDFCAQQIGENAESPRNPGRQLPEPGVASENVNAFSVVGYEQSAGPRRLSRVIRLEHGTVPL